MLTQKNTKKHMQNKVLKKFTKSPCRQFLEASFVIFLRSQYNFFLVFFCVIFRSLTHTHTKTHKVQKHVLTHTNLIFETTLVSGRESGTEGKVSRVGLVDPRR